MFSNPQLLRPLMMPESAIGHFRNISENDVAHLMRTATRIHLTALMPAGIIHFPYGEPETMLAEVCLGNLKPDGSDKSLAFLDGLRVRSDQLMGAAQFMKLFPDKDLTRFIARGGNPLSVYQDRDQETERLAKATGSKETVPARTIGEILSDAVTLSRKSSLSTRLHSDASITYMAWLDHVVQLIGRRPSQSEKVTTNSSLIADVASRLLERRDGQSWVDDLAKGLIALYYLYFSAQEDALVYKADYSSNMFTRFVSIRLRDYACFYASLHTIPTLLKTRLREESVKTLLMILGDSSAPATTIADLSNSLHTAMGGERIRAASLFLPLVDSAIAAYKAAYHVENLLLLDERTKDLFSEFGNEADFFKPMALNPSYSEVKVGPKWLRKYMAEGELGIIRSSALSTLRSALIDINALAADLPALEAGSTLFDGGPKPSFEFPSLDQPRFLCVGDACPYAVGVSAVEVDSKGRLNDTLLPHMGRLFNYTSYAQARKSPFASRLLSANADPSVGLPDDMSDMPVPINYLEGEKNVPIRLSLQDLPTSCGDYLRNLEGILCSLSAQEFPYVLSQLAAAFIVLVKGKIAERVQSFGSPMTDGWIALVPKVTETHGLKPAFIKQYTYGVDTAEIIEANLQYYEKITSTLIIHPDATVEVALLPLVVIPASKVGYYDYTYVLAAAHKLVPVSKLVKGEAEPTKYEPAFFSSVRAKRHGQNWVCARTLAENNPLITVQQPGVVIAYRPNLVGYLDEKALVSSPSPWKVKPVEVTQIMPDPKAAAEIVAEGSAPSTPVEKL